MPGKADHPAQILLFATDVARQVDGRIVLTPRRPAAPEIPTVEAARILGVSRAQMWYIRNTPLGQRHLRWRFISDKKGKILWDTSSVLAYREATTALED